MSHCASSPAELLVLEVRGIPFSRAAGWGTKRQSPRRCGAVGAATALFLLHLWGPGQDDPPLGPATGVRVQPGPSRRCPGVSRGAAALPAPRHPARWGWHHTAALPHPPLHPAPAGGGWVEGRGGGCRLGCCWRPWRGGAGCRDCRGLMGWAERGKAVRAG